MLLKNIKAPQYRTRSFPVNLKSIDSKLFANAINVEVKLPTTVRLFGAYILDDTVFSLKKMKYYSHYTHSNGIGGRKALRLLVNIFKKKNKIDSGIWITDNFSYAYYHWVVECLTRLFELDFNEKKYPILLPVKFKNLSYAQQSLDLLGFSVHYYDTKKPYYVTKLILPSITARGMSFSIESLSFQKKVFSNKIVCNNVPYRKIYITRKNSNSRKVLNEHLFVDFFKRYGIEVFNLENLSFIEQVKIFSETTLLIGPHGAGLANMMYLPKESIVLEIKNKYDDYWNMFYGMALDLGHKYFYILAEPTTDDTHDSNLIVDIDEFENVIHQIIHNNL